MSGPTENETNRESFNEEFCVKLEYHLGKIFGSAHEKEFHGFWCDGVEMPLIDSQLTKTNVNNTRTIISKAWLGYDGQGAYEMTIRFGKYSLRRYARGTNMDDCLPDGDFTEWITLDMEKRTIELQLL